MQFAVTSIGHASHAIHYNSFLTSWRSAYRRDEFKAKSNTTTTGWKLKEDFGLLNMIIKPTLHSIHKFDHQWFYTLTATSFSLQIILSSFVACKSWKNKFPYKSKRILPRDSSLPEILLLFLLIQLESKVLEIKSKIKRHYLE